MINTYTQNKYIKVEMRKGIFGLLKYSVTLLLAGVFTGTITQSSWSGLLVSSAFVAIAGIFFLATILFNRFNNYKIEIDNYTITINRLFRSPKEITFTSITKIAIESDNITNRTGTAFQRIVIETYDGKHDHLLNWFDRYALMCELSRKAMTYNFIYETKNYDPTTEMDS